MSNLFRSPAATMALRSGLYALRSALLEAANHGNTSAYRRAMSDWYLAADAYIAIVTSDRTFTCRSGCSACCFDNPQAISAAEVALLEDRVDETMRAQLEADVARFQQIERDFTGFEAIGVAFKSEKRPCPFLELESGQCRVYKIRPIACRDFFSESQAEWCHPDHIQNENVRQLAIEWPTAVRDLLLRISRCLHPNRPESSLREALLERLNAPDRGSQ